MRRLILLLTVLAGSLMMIHAQSDDWFMNKPISDIRFEGLQRIRVQELNGVIAPYIGKPLTTEILADLQRKLYSLEYFDLLTPEPREIDEKKAAVLIVYTVVERPTLSQVLFIGNAGLRNADLFGVIKTKSGDAVSKPKINLDAEEIKKLYLEKGFATAQISWDLKEVKDRPQVRELVYTIAEGNQTTVRALRFSGNTFASEGTLKGLLKTKEQALFQPGAYQEAFLKEDTDAILKYYKEQGFVDADIKDIKRETSLEEKESKEFLTITYIIEEGQQWNFGGWEFTGNKIFSSEKLLAATRSKKGAILNESTIRSDFQAITDVYYDQGYANNTINPVPTKDQETRTITYRTKIEERGIAYIGDIVIRGNVKTKREIIEREIPFKVGDVFSTEKIKQAYYNLLNTKFFSNVTPDAKPNSETGLFQVIFTVEEQVTIDLRVGGSLSGDQEFPIAFIGKWSDVNFGGEGRTIGADLSVSGREQSIKLNFNDGWLFGESFGGGIGLGVARAEQKSLYRTWDDYAFGGSNNVVNALNTKIEPVYSSYINWDISLNTSISKTWRFRPGRVTVGGGLGTEFNHLEYDPELWVPYDAKIRANQKRFVPINQMSVNASFDSRDIYFDPSYGFYASQGFVLYGGLLFGERNYIRSESTLQYWLTLWDIPVFEGWNLKSVLGFNSSMSILLPQFWTPEGVDAFSASDRLLTVNPMVFARGWYNWSTTLGVDGGEILWNNWVEFRTPIVRNALSLDFYFDAVRLMAKRDDIFANSGKGWMFGYGGGLRLAMQGLPLRLYLGKRFSLTDGGSVVWQKGSLFGSSGANSTDGVDLIFAISLF